MKLSIIIPVYRVEATLDRCIESVLRQDFTDFEVILVDDGSPDHCPTICDEWATRDQRIHVIHQANGGLSDARNTGIAAAQGDYLTFIDSDDLIEAGTLTPLMTYLAQNPETDILEYPALLFCGSPQEHRLDFPEETIYHDMDVYWYEGRAYQHTYAWNKIYRASLFQQVRYPKGVVFEDICTLAQLLKHTRTLATCNSGCYHYCYNPRGITATADGTALRTLLENHVRIISGSQRHDTAFSAYYLQVLNIQIDVYERTGDPPILPLRKVSPAQFNLPSKFKIIIQNILGIKALCKIIKLCHQLYRSRSSVSS